MARENLGEVYERGWRTTAFGMALYIRIYREDNKPMSWREVQDCFNKIHPGKWACSWHPPEDCLIDHANIYHLFVFDEEPVGMNIRRRDNAC